MKTIIYFITTIFAGVVAQLTGWSLPILTVVNFAFLLFKDSLLFPWVYLLWIFFAFIGAIITVFISAIFLVQSQD